MTTQRFYRNVMETLGDRDREAVKRATAAVFHSLRDRLTVEEADQVVAQLPAELKNVWHQGEAPGRRPLKLGREEFYERVRRDSGAASRQEARRMTVAVFAGLKEQLSPGEADDVFAQLPRDLKDVWADAEVGPHRVEVAR